MGKFEEVAVIFKRQKLSDGSTKFIPDEIIDGYFDEDDEWFVDRYGHTYHHICELTNSGKAFGFREPNKRILDFAKDQKISYDVALERILTSAKKFNYMRMADDSFHIVVTNPDGESGIFTDKDTERISQIYTSLESIKRENKPSEKSDYTDLIPIKIADEVKKEIVAQDEAIKTVVTQIIMTKRFPNLKKRNMFLVGPTGVGKTAIMEILSKILKIPLTIFSVPGLSQAGYVGGNINDILKSALIKCNFDVSKVENSIIVLDEIDKIGFRGYDSGSISTEGVQDELLKLIEGDKRTIEFERGKKGYTIDTSKIIFIGTGACQEFYNRQERRTVGFETPEPSKKVKSISSDDLVNLGLKPELIGRLPVLIELNCLTKKDLITILKNPYGELAKMIEAFASMGITLSNIDELYDMIAEDALRKNIGARGIVATVTKIFTEASYIVLSYPGVYKELVFGEHILEDKDDFILVPKNVKERVRQIN